MKKYLSIIIITICFILPANYAFSYTANCLFKKSDVAEKLNTDPFTISVKNKTLWLTNSKGDNVYFFAFKNGEKFCYKDKMNRETICLGKFINGEFSIESLTHDSFYIGICKLNKK